MHYLVRLIVDSETMEDAKDEAEHVLSTLGEGCEFDWYQTSADESCWEDCWNPVPLSSKKGLALVTDAMDSQLNEFKQTMQSVRLMLSTYSDEQIFNEEFTQASKYYFSRWQFGKVSGFLGKVCRLFGEGGDSIINQKMLDWYLNNAEKLWVVQVDCHN